MGSYQSAVRTLATGQKPAQGVSYYSRWVNRPAGRRFAAALHIAGLSPNQVSLLSGAVTALGIVLIATREPSWPGGATIALLLAVGFMLDAADGQLARLRGTASAAGEWLDHFLDAAKMVALHAAVLISWYRFFDPPPGLLLVPLAFQLAAVCLFAGGTLATLLRRSSTTGGRPVSGPTKVRAFFLLPVDYGILCWSFLFLGSPALFMGVYVVLAAVQWAFLFAFIAKWFKELKQL